MAPGLSVATVVVRVAEEIVEEAVECCKVVTVGLMLCAEARFFLYSRRHANHFATCDEFHFVINKNHCR